MKFNVEGIVDDSSKMVEPGWRESHEANFLTVDWNKEEEDDINRRMRFILTYTDDWLQQRTRGSTSEPPVEVTSSLELPLSDVSFSPVAGDTVILDTRERSPLQPRTTAPRTRSRSKSAALEQIKNQEQEMTSKSQDSGDGLDQSDSGDGDVQLIEAPKEDQPRFLTPIRDAQTKPPSPAIPSWLSNSINKKRSLQPVSTPV